MVEPSGASCDGRGARLTCVRVAAGDLGLAARGGGCASLASSRRCGRNALRRMILPVPVTLKRLAAPRWVFILGIVGLSCVAGRGRGRSGRGAACWGSGASAVGVGAVPCRSVGSLLRRLGGRLWRDRPGRRPLLALSSGLLGRSAPACRAPAPSSCCGRRASGRLDLGRPRRPVSATRSRICARARDGPSRGPGT